MRPVIPLLALAIALAGAASAQEGSLALARADFVAHCGACHGDDGTGSGPKAEGLARHPADLTRIAARHGGTFPADAVFETISGLDMPDAHGTREMPVWGDVFVSEAVGGSVKLEDALKASDDAAQRIAGLVAFIESIQSNQ